QVVAGVVLQHEAGPGQPRDRATDRVGRGWPAARGAIARRARDAIAGRPRDAVAGRPRRAVTGRAIAGHAPLARTTGTGGSVAARHPVAGGATGSAPGRAADASPRCPARARPTPASRAVPSAHAAAATARDGFTRRTARP